MISRIGISCITAVLLAGQAASQIGGGSGGGQTGVCLPSGPVCCKAIVQTETVTGSGPAYILNPGTPVTETVVSVDCFNCEPNSCNWPICEGNGERDCSAGATHSSSYTATAIINPELSVGLNAATKISLGVRLGATIGVTVAVSVSCPVVAGSCEDVYGWIEKTTIQGKTAAVDHNITKTGVWADRVSVSLGCISGDCSLAGSTWTHSCATTKSTGTVSPIHYACPLPIPYDDECHECP